MIFVLSFLFLNRAFFCVEAFPVHCFFESSSLFLRQILNQVQDDKKRGGLFTFRFSLFTLLYPPLMVRARLAWLKTRKHMPNVAKSQKACTLMAKSHFS